ncbi:hypothetical protein ABK040_013176 [Willaertia magna]
MSLNQLPDELLLEIIYFLIGNDNTTSKTTTNQQQQQAYPYNYESIIPPIENLLSFQSLFNIIKQVGNNNKENLNLLLNNYLLNQYNYFTKILYFLLTNPLLNTHFISGDVLAYEAQQMMNLQKLIFKKERGLFIKDMETINPNRPSWSANEPYEFDEDEFCSEDKLERIEKKFNKRLNKLCDFNNNFIDNFNNNFKNNFSNNCNDDLLDIFDLLFYKLSILSLQMYKSFDNFLEEHERYCDFSITMLSQENQFDTIYNSKKENDKNKYEFHLERNDLSENQIDWNQNYCNELFKNNNYFIFSITNFTCNYQPFIGDLFDNIIFPNCIQFLSISYLFDSYYSYWNTFPESFKFPNVKYLRIYVKSDYLDNGFGGSEEGKDFEKDFYTSLLKRKHFPKLVHLSINGLENHNILFDCNVLSQLLVLDIRHVEGYYVKQRLYSPNDEYYIPTFIAKLKEKSKTDDNWNLKQLIIYCRIHQRYTDTLDLDALKNIYKSTANVEDCKFIFSIALSGICDYCYYSCNE